jgi:hypothetical protein
MVPLGVRTGMELSRPDGIYLRPDACGTQRPDDQDRRPNARDQSAHFLGSSHPDGLNTPSGRGPHKGYIHPWSLFLLPTPPQSHFLAFSELFLECFWLYLIPLCLFVH